MYKYTILSLIKNVLKIGENNHFLLYLFVVLDRISWYTECQRQLVKTAFPP